MDELQKAIDEITYFSEDFPGKAFEVITANKEEAVPYLREAVEYAINKKTELEKDYQLHFYALYLLAEFQDREFFPKIVECVSLPGDVVDNLIGDCVTTDLRDILYNTYNGDIQLLKESIKNKEINEYVRADMLGVMGQLYLDGKLAEDEWKDILKHNVYHGGEYDYLYDATGAALCRCHFIDMLPEIRYMFDNDLLDTMCMGKYDSYVDAMFEYREDERDFCNASVNTADTLRTWAMFTQEPKDTASGKSEKDFNKIVREMERKMNPPAKKVKVGRNDPCPCGSGKKYKMCCLNKPKEGLDAIESPEERDKWLRNYPYTGQERIEGRIYLEDYFDPAAIEVDKIIYLGMKHRLGLLWNRDNDAEERRKREYLYIAFQKFTAIMEEEQLGSFAEYDEKYGIHYRCEEWIGELIRRLNDNYSDIQRYKEVTEWTKRHS